VESLSDDSHSFDPPEKNAIGRMTIHGACCVTAGCKYNRYLSFIE
jgi:hypothetical protein